MNTWLRQLPGFQSSYWAVDRTRGAMMAVSTWDTREHASFSREALIAADTGAAAVSRGMQDTRAQMQPPEVYEMAAQA